ncbi:hypothetical protein [Gemmobacter sp.]|uniref:hypothetical protein n=1 Tax=Gemmobacter sp. TaxID=1898957 RepID=UPI002AFDFC19|nr:hypothetical protein [Gemmobacter sp.]
MIMGTKGFDLALAHSVIRSPERHDDDVLHAACDVLERDGEWPDVVLAQQLRRQLRVRGLRRAFAGITFHDALSVALLVLMLVALTWVAAGLGGPTGAAELGTDV